MRRAAAGAAFAALAGCVRIPDVYAPPIQRRDPWEIQQGLKHYIHLAQPEAADHIVRDIVPDPENGPWRWTLQHPAFRFRVPTTQGIRFRAEVTVPDVTFEQTGAVTISFRVAGRLLGSEQVKKPGDFIFEKPVPPEWLTTGSPILVELDIDKLWVSPADGVRRGFILRRLGFLQ